MPGLTEVRPGRKKARQDCACLEPVGGVAGKQDGSFVGQRIDHFVGIGSGLHDVDGGTVDLTTNSNTEIAIGDNFAAVLLFGRNAIGVNFSIKELFSHRLPVDWNEQRKFLGLPEKDYTAK